MSRIDMPIHPYDPTVDDEEDEKLHDINDLIEQILHGEDDRWANPA